MAVLDDEVELAKLEAEIDALFDCRRSLPMSPEQRLLLKFRGQVKTYLKMLIYQKNKQAARRAGPNREWELKYHREWMRDYRARQKAAKEQGNVENR